METNFRHVLKWFTGKSLVEATKAIDILEESVRQGYWVKGGGLKVTSRLSKSNVAAKFAKANGWVLESIGKRPSKFAAEGDTELSDYKTPQERRGWSVHHEMRYGGFANAQQLDFVALRDEAIKLFDSPRNAQGQDLVAQRLQALKIAQEWAQDFAPIAAAVTKLDATKPKPVFTTLGVSPTITRTLEGMGIAGTVETIRMPEIAFKEVAETLPNGKVFYHQVAYVVWPPGTQHRKAKHAYGNGKHDQCHACGHGIRNAYNWVPVLVDDAAGVPHSLWVGRDCSQSLFGIEMTGELELAPGQRV